MITQVIQRGLVVIEPLVDLIGISGCICGGYARYCLSPNPQTSLPSDVDIFPYTGRYEKLKTRLDSKLEIRNENDIAVTYKKCEDDRWKYIPAVQLIKPKDGFSWGDTQQIIDGFDFSICRAALHPLSALGLCDDDFLGDEEAKRLRVKHIVCAFSTLTRTLRYTAKGYHMPYSQLVLLLQAVGEQDTTRIFDLILNDDLSREEIDELETLLSFD